MAIDTDLFLKSRVLILGCGWVGEEFAKSMVASGAEVWATTTSDSKITRFKELGVKPILANFDVEVNNLDSFGEFDYVLNSVPASSRHQEEELKKRFHHIYQFLSRLKFGKQIFLSSIGIYPDIDGVFDESWESDLNVKLLLAENEMCQIKNTMIYRLGGLFGKERVFAKYFSDKICHTGNQPANFVHVEDVVKLVMLGFLNFVEGEKYNIVTPEHPTKKQVIIASASKYAFKLPLAFEPTATFQKIVSGSKIIAHLDYTFTYNSPLLF